MKPKRSRPTHLQRPRGNRKGHAVGWHCEKDKMLYEGDWLDGKAEGLGITTWPDNLGNYAGEYKSGAREGRGAITFHDSSHWEGDWEKDKLVFGKYMWPQTGRTYIGEWRELWRHGFGVYYWPDGSQYIGQWMNDKR